MSNHQDRDQAYRDYVQNVLDTIKASNKNKPPVPSPDSSAHLIFQACLYLFVVGCILWTIWEMIHGRMPSPHPATGFDPN